MDDVKALARVEAKLEDHERRITNTERTQEQIIELNRQTAVIMEQMVNVKCDIGDLKDGVKEIQEDLREHTMEPAKKWTNFMWMIFSLVVGAVVGYLIKQIGL